MTGGISLPSLNRSIFLSAALYVGNRFVWFNARCGRRGRIVGSQLFWPSTTNCFPAFDGNGNVAALVNAADGTVAANYDYGPFGEVIRATGPMAKVNPFRFSTKYQDDESDLLYYGYRYYKPSTGTWPNRDPFGELGFELVASKPETGKKSFLERAQVVLAFFRQQNPQLVESFKTSLAEDRRALLESSQQNGNLYAFVANTPINSQDLLGLKSPSDGFTCDTNLLSALRILCHCVIARGHTIAGGCNGVVPGVISIVCRNIWMAQ